MVITQPSFVILGMANHHQFLSGKLAWMWGEPLPFADHFLRKPLIFHIHYLC
jgi:hypothetical protein